MPGGGGGAILLRRGLEMTPPLELSLPFTPAPHREPGEWRTPHMGVQGWLGAQLSVEPQV